MTTSTELHALYRSLPSHYRTPFFRWVHTTQAHVAPINREKVFQRWLAQVTAWQPGDAVVYHGGNRTITLTIPRGWERSDGALVDIDDKTLTIPWEQCVSVHMPSLR